jgi:hypothetical protein
LRAQQRGLNVRDWVQGFGYIRLRQQIHRAEEILTLFTPVETLIAEAWHDELRLQGSNIDNREALLTRLRDAVAVLVERQRLYLKLPPPASQVVPQYTIVDEFAAREVLRRIEQAINEFRDESRMGLVRARNRLIKTITLTGMVGFSLVALTVLVGAPAHNLIAAAAFYLVGAIVGLFNQLYLDASTETATEDYGLATARLVHTALFSGLAAIGGVLIIPMLSLLVNDSGAIKDTLVPTVVSIFDLNKRPFGLVLAAIFGLSPTVLIARLQQEAEKYKADLKSSGAPARR